MSVPLETLGLGKRIRRVWALRDCTLRLPERAVVGLAGPNGAGKSTLLELAVGLLAPTEGRIRVLGGEPWRDHSTLEHVGYVAQDAPLYRSFTVGETLELGRRTNRRWDESFATALLTRMGRGDRVALLSAGDRARLALAVALAKRPALVLLDEPFASLDPLAGRDFLRTLMDGVAAIGATVVVASRVVADIERVCDHIVLLVDGRVRLAGDVEELLASHRLLTGARRPLGPIRGVEEVISSRYSHRQMTLLVRQNAEVGDPAWSVDPIALEELLLAYMAIEPLPEARPPLKEGRLIWHG